MKIFEGHAIDKNARYKNYISAFNFIRESMIGNICTNVTVPDVAKFQQLMTHEFYGQLKITPGGFSYTGPLYHLGSLPFFSSIDCLKISNVSASLETFHRSISPSNYSGYCDRYLSFSTSSCESIIRLSSGMTDSTEFPFFSDSPTASNASSRVVL